MPQKQQFQLVSASDTSETCIVQSVQDLILLSQKVFWKKSSLSILWLLYINALQSHRRRFHQWTYMVAEMAT